ncbi:MAG: hypothetical protein RI568_05975 [Natronomonas sp.]|jgi:hypothetical protein|uniref:DUF7344 domain-containing protein n=1 Tax=Natronomonas sp. TaxID=2184060 RepID=UPI002870A30F|nr:hypothetical protein [Natronomonas sp.]MDR9430234.1 hypothetical protein [Natronomonas sp.]
MVEWSTDENAVSPNPNGRELSIDAEQLDDLPGKKRQRDGELDIGDVFELLKNERRRRVIRFLNEQEDGVTTLNVMAEHIAALENDIDVSQLSSSQRKRVYIGLYQCHLPKMDEYGVIDFQKNRGIITLKNTTQLESYLPNEDGEGSATEDRTETGDVGDVDAEANLERSDLFAASAIAAAVAIGAVGLGPLAAVPSGLWIAVSLVALLWFARN